MENQKEQESSTQSLDQPKIYHHDKQYKEFLFNSQGLFSLSQNNQHSFKLESPFPSGCGSFQVSRKLFASGGNLSVSHAACINQFSCFSYQGEGTALASLLFPRTMPSLSGNTHSLLTIGGFNKISLKSCQKYSISANKASALPALNQGRYQPGSCLLSSATAFCFCGGSGMAYLHSIQSLQLGSACQWKLLPLDERIGKTGNLAAVSERGRILLFGGTLLTYFHLFSFSQEGGLKENLSDRQLIPGYMCQEPAIVQRGKVFAVAYKESKQVWKWRLLIFENNEWIITD